MKSPEINPYTYGHLIDDKGGKTIQRRKDISSVSGAGKTVQLYAKDDMRTHLNTIHKRKLLLKDSCAQTHLAQGPAQRQLIASRLSSIGCSPIYINVQTSGAWGAI